MSKIPRGIPTDPALKYTHACQAGPWGECLHSCYTAGHKNFWENALREKDGIEMGLDLGVRSVAPRSELHYCCMLASDSGSMRRRYLWMNRAARWEVAI
jgi:hypothetical protein